MPRFDVTQRGRAFMNAVKRVIDSQVMPALYTLVQRERVQSTTGSAGARPVATGSDDESITIYETYGFASTPSGTGITLAFSPGTDSEDRVAIGVSSTGARPETAAGDAAVYTSAGHVILLDNDGGITITARPGASVTINVDAGQSANIGGTPAFALVKDAENTTAIGNALAAGAAFVGTPGDPAGTNASGAFAAAVLAYNGSPSAATTKAKGV